MVAVEDGLVHALDVAGVGDFVDGDDDVGPAAAGGRRVKAADDLAGIDDHLGFVAAQVVSDGDLLATGPEDLGDGADTGLGVVAQDVKLG